MRFALACLTVALGLAAPAAAQSGRHDVTGVVADSTDVGLPGATVMLLQEADSVLVSFAAATDDGAFRLRRVPAGSYLLKVTFVGYAPYTAGVTVADADVDVGRVRLAADDATLGRLVVDAERVPLVLRGDTLDFDAAAFETPAGASVEDLLRRLPGVEVERDGSIRAMGEEVDKVLVDGKEFFGDDPTIATRNLPAEAVDRVELYDDQSDTAEFTGVADGNEERTINLALKEDHKAGMFGSATGGLGGTAPYEDGARFDGHLSLNRFSPTTQISVLANVNNVNRQGFSFGDYLGFMGGMPQMGGGGGTFTLSSGDLPIGDDASDGFATTVSGGLNLNHEFSDATNVRASYFGHRVTTDRAREVRQRQVVGQALSSLVALDADQADRRLAHRLTLSAEHAFAEGHDLRLRSNLRASDALAESVGRQTTAGASDALQNESVTAKTSDGRTLAGDAALTYRRRLGGGRSVVAELGADLNDVDTDGDLASTVRFFQAGDLLTTEEVAQVQRQRGGTLTHSQEVLLTQPLGRQRALQAHVEHRLTSEDQDRDVRDRVDGALVPNDLLSLAFERAYRYVRGGVTYRDNREPLQLSAGLDVQRSVLDGEVAGAGAPIDRSYVHLLPSATLSYEFPSGPRLNLQYRTSTREPSLRQLQPVVDNRDPLDLYVGNPDLQPEFGHSLNARFFWFDQFTFTNLFAFARASYRPNAISTARTIDDQLRRTSTPVNLGGAWTVNGNAAFGTPIRRLKAKVNLSVSTLLDLGTERINGVDNDARLLRNTVDLRLENRTKDHVDLQAGARYAFNAASYALSPQFDRDYVNRTFYAELGLTPSDAWDFRTTLDLALYDDDVFGEARAVPLWDAELSRTVMDGRVRLQLVARDLLDRNVGVEYTNAGSYIEEERVASLGRYVLLKATYTLSGARPGGGPGMIRIAN